MRFFGALWKNTIQKAYLPKISIPGEIVFVILAQLCSDDSLQILLNLTQVIITIRNHVKFRRICMESSDQNRPSICETIYPASFWQVGLSELVLSKYSNKSHNFKNLIFMTSSL